eukprot:853658_1
MSTMIPYCLFLIHSIHGQTQIWYEKMDSSSASWLDNPPSSIETNNTLCPTPNLYCWAFTSGLFAKRTDNTTQFTAVQLVYSISGSNLNDEDCCVIEYSTDNIIFYDIARISSTTTGITNTFNGWGPGADLQPSLTIQLSTVEGNGHTCYFNELILQGTPVTRLMITTYAPPLITPCNNGTERVCYYGMFKAVPT